MSEENIPQKIDPFRFAENGIHVTGSLPIKSMERLCDALYQNSGDIGVDIQFGKNEQGIPFVKGQLSGALRLQCQRCMNSFDYEVTNQINLVIVHTETEAEELPLGYDALVAKDDILIIPDMVEDELIVSLPVVPMHKPAECNVMLPIALDSEQVAETEKESPFKVIEFLREKRNPK